MSNAQAKDYFNQGMAFYQRRDYGPALQKMETALSLVESWDTQLRDNMRHIIEEVRLCAKDKAAGDYYRSQAEDINRQLRQLGY